MFSFLKKMRQLIKTMKAKKGLWFSLLTAISISGITIFMYILTTMTESVKVEVYDSISETYNSKFDRILIDKNKAYKDIVTSLKSDKILLKNLGNNNKKFLNKKEKELNNLFSLKNDKFNNIIIGFYSAADNKTKYRGTIYSILSSKQKIFGFEQMEDGIFLVYLEPITLNNKFLGIIEVKEKIHTLRNNFLSDNSDSAFLINKVILTKLNLKTKNNNYKDLLPLYSVNNKAYSNKFYIQIKDHGETNFEKFLEQKYISDDIYYRTYKKIVDINGGTLGLYVMGEETAKNNGFVTIADKMSKNVTVVALGLVISILLFMF